MQLGPEPQRPSSWRTPGALCSVCLCLQPCPQQQILSQQHLGPPEVTRKATLSLDGKCLTLGGNEDSVKWGGQKEIVGTSEDPAALVLYEEDLRGRKHGQTPETHSTEPRGPGESSAPPQGEGQERGQLKPVHPCGCGSF